MQCGLKFFSNRQQSLGVIKNDASSISQLDTPGESAQQINTPALLELSQLDGHRGLRKVERLRSTRDASQLCGHMEQQKLMEVQVQCHSLALWQRLGENIGEVSRTSVSGRDWFYRPRRSQL